MKILARYIFLALLSLPPAIQAQQAYRCSGSGQITYSDKPCNNESQERRINVKPNSVDTSAERAYTERQQSRREQEQEAWAQEHQRQSAAIQNAAADQRYEKERKELMRHATTVLPGSKGGLTRSQREMAVGLSKTQEERDELMREATTVTPGAPGLTASQRDSASRLSAANRGRPMPPPAPIDNTPPPQQPSPATPEPPSLIVNCDPAGCWDTSGRRLNNAGGGNFSRGDGKLCTRAGPNVICH